MAKNYCHICQTEIDTRLGDHVTKVHHMDHKEYYNKYLLKGTENVCPTCGVNEPAFLGLTKGYRHHCSNSCSSLDPKVQEKNKATCIEHFGYSNAFLIPEVQEKAQANSHTPEAIAKQHEGYVKTCQEKYNADNIWSSEYGRNKMKETNLERYGNEFSSANEEVRKKISNTVRSKECQERTKQTNRERYGKDYYSQTDEYKEKCKNTCQERYNEDHPMKNKEISEKVSNTRLNFSEEKKQSIKEKSNKTKEERYGNPNYNNREKAKCTCLAKYELEVPNQYGSKQYEQNMESKYGENWKSYVGNAASEGLHKNIFKFEQENNCTLISTVMSEYGQGWLSIRDTIQTLKHNSNVYVLNSEIDNIIEYNKNNYLSGKSRKEQDIVDFIHTFYNGEIETNIRRIISPLELDIYLPDLKLAIEFNGTYWHSVEANTSINYHLIKSLRCKDIGVRLIHIYEF